MTGSQSKDHCFKYRRMHKLYLTRYRIEKSYKWMMQEVKKSESRIIAAEGENIFTLISEVAAVN